MENEENVKEYLLQGDLEVGTDKYSGFGENNTPPLPRLRD